MPGSASVTRIQSHGRRRNIIRVILDEYVTDRLSGFKLPLASCAIMITVTVTVGFCAAGPGPRLSRWPLRPRRSRCGRGGRKSSCRQGRASGSGSGYPTECPATDCQRRRPGHYARHGDSRGDPGRGRQSRVMSPSLSPTGTDSHSDAAATVTRFDSRRPGQGDEPFFSSAGCCVHNY